jgi:plastocyanin
MRAMRRIAATVVAVGILVAPAACFSDRSAGPVAGLEGCNVDLPPEAFGSSIVVIRDFAFTPALMTVKPGSKVTWVNCEQPGSESHTSTADAGAWSSPLLAPGATYTRQFDAVGPYPYHCTPHPGMTGSVRVE